MRRTAGLLVATTMLLLGGLIGSARAQFVDLVAGSQLTLGSLVFTVTSCTVSGVAGWNSDCSNSGIQLAANGPLGLIIEMPGEASPIFSVDCTSGTCASPDLTVNLDLAALTPHLTLTSVTEGLVGSYSPVTNPANTFAEFSVTAGETITASDGVTSFGVPSLDLSSPSGTVATNDIAIPGTSCISSGTCVTLVKDFGIADFNSNSVLNLTAVTQNFVTGVPEPGSSALLAFGLLALAATRLKQLRN